MDVPSSDVPLREQSWLTKVKQNNHAPHQRTDSQLHASHGTVTPAQRPQMLCHADATVFEDAEEVVSLRDPHQIITSIGPFSNNVRVSSGELFQKITLQDERHGSLPKPSDRVHGILNHDDLSDGHCSTTPFDHDENEETNISHSALPVDGVHQQHSRDFDDQQDTSKVLLYPSDSSMSIDE